MERDQSKSRNKHRQRGLWQKRSWEHTVEDEDDLKRSIDEIHRNPRKHRLVTRVQDWKGASFHRFIRASEYDLEWGE